MTLTIGVTGRAGSGKSFFQKAVESMPELHILDLDHVGHEVLRMSETKQKLREHFGEAPFDEAGEINRKALGDLVFNKPEALAILNNISHPMIFKRASEIIVSCPAPCCLLVGALIHEIGLDKLCNYMIVIDADDAVIREWSPKQFARHAFQASRETFLRRADLVLINTFDVEFEVSSRRIMRAILEEKQQG